MSDYKVLYIGPIHNSNLADSGYNTASAGLIYTLQDMKSKGKIKELTIIDINDLSNQSKIESITTRGGKYDISITITSPFSFLNPIVSNTASKLLALSSKNYLGIVWETYPLPNSWKQVIDSELFTGFIAPSHFVTALLKDYTTKPVYYCPYFIDSILLDRVDIDYKVNDEKVFTALFIGQNTKRKGIDDAITAFAIALGDKEDCELYLKSHSLSNKELPLPTVTQLHMFTNCINIKAKVFISENTISREEIHELHKSSSVLLYPSRGEGFSLPCQEAICAGIPVIYTNWSSLYETCSMDGNIPIDYTMDEAYNMAHHRYEKGAVYSVPIISDIVRALENKYNLWKGDRRKYYEIVSKNHEEVNKRYGCDSVSKCIEYIIEGNKGIGPTDLLIPEIIDKFNNDFANINIRKNI